MAKLYDQGVHHRGVGLGDLVLYKAKVNDPTRSWGNLTLKCEELYQIIEVEIIE